MISTWLFRNIQSPALRKLALFLVLLVCIVAPSDGFSQELSTSQTMLSVRDARDQVITLDQPARRIVALYGAYNEILFAMGLEDRLVARTNADTFPASIQALPSIGTHMRPNIERIVGLQPDLVLQMGGRSQALQSVQDLERFGITTALFEITSFEQLFDVIAQLGVLTDEQQAAIQLTQSLKERLARIATSLEHIDTLSSQRPTVLFEVRSPNLLAAGSRSMVSDIIIHAGGINCLEHDQKFVRLNDEELLRLAPEVYLVQRGPMNPAPVPVANRDRMAGLPAVLQHNIHELDEQMYSRPGPRNVDAVEQLAALLWPNIFVAQPLPQ